MILKVYIVFGFCVFFVNSAVNITTENGKKIFLHNKGIDIRDSESIYFKVRSCGETFMDLVSDSFGTVTDYPLYQVHFGKRYIYFLENPSETVLDIDNTVWPTHHCEYYVPFWVSWICGTIEAGNGPTIGYYKFNNWDMDITKIDVTDISIMSYTTADWIFDIPKITTSDCTPDESVVGSRSGPTIIRTTETTTPELGSTTKGFTVTTPELATTTKSSTDSTTPEFATTKSSTDTTTPEFATTKSSTDTTTPKLATTTKISTTTTTPELATTKSSTDTTTPEFATTKSSTDTTTPEFATTKSSTDTTTPEFATTKSSTDTTTPELTTTKSLTDTPTPEFDLTTISTIISTATTASSRTTYRSSTKTPCTCPCNNSTMTEDELIRKIALLKSELSVDRKQTNKYKRSLTSAGDDRPSSKYIGTFGIVVLVVICTLIVLMDLQHCACFMFQKKKKIIPDY